MSSLLLKGASLIDPKNKLFGRYDLAIRDGKISEISEFIKTELFEQVFRLPGTIICPGFINLHCHLDFLNQDFGLGLIPDHHSFSSGITTMIDAGSCGSYNAEKFV